MRSSTSFFHRPVALRAMLAFPCCIWFAGCAALSTTPLDKVGNIKPVDFEAGQVYSVPVGGYEVRAPVTSWRRIQRTNVVMQRLDYSCGSAALATLLQYYFEDDVDEQKVLRTIFDRLAKADKPQEEINDRVENGFSMLDLLNAAKDLGYLGAVVRVPIEKLKESKAPVIVRIEKYDYKHFVVFRGIHQDTVYLADPIRGNIRLSIQEFMEQWSGESLFLGKTGFGLPEDYPLALDKTGPARPELQIAREALYWQFRP